MSKKFNYEKPSIDSYKTNRDYNFTAIYDNAHTELSLQQSKRDQIIALYLTLVSFLIPFAFNVESFNDAMRGALFLVLFIIGMILGIIIIRYKVYKEVYWICCQTISQLMNFDDKKINKSTVQSVFYQVLRKKNPTKNGNVKAIRKSIFSAETLIFEIHVLISASTLIISSYLLTHILHITIILSIAYLILINYLFFKAYFKVFKVCKTNDDNDFNYAFSKAWFLHLYPTIETE